jgi:putative phosphoesterase
MKIGILSDSHNDGAALKQALQIFNNAGINTLFHCGDITSPQMLIHLKGFTVNYVYGNMDSDPMEIRKQIKLLNPENEIGITVARVFANKRIAVTHGHLSDILDELILSGENDFVFHGHTHRRRDELLVDTRVLNPGALGGARHEPRSVCILDLESGDAQFIDLS